MPAGRGVCSKGCVLKGVAADAGDVTADGCLLERVFDKRKINKVPLLSAWRGHLLRRSELQIKKVSAPKYAS